MTSEKPTNSKRVSVSKRKLANTAGEMEAKAAAATLSGGQKAALGTERLEAAADMAAAGAAVLAKGASDVTQAVDQKIVSERMAVLSEAVGSAGMADIAEGAAILAKSEDVSVMSALVGMMSSDGIEHGMELARLSGELHTASEMVVALKMPVLANLLAKRAARLHEMSVEQIRLAISTSGISQILAATGQEISDLGSNEVEEGMTRLTVSRAASEESKAMSKASDELAVQGMEEMILAEKVGKTARREANEGAGEISAGAAVMGAALTMENVADTLKKKSE
jgi:hypothetical protein